MHVFWIPFWNRLKGTQRLCEHRIEVGQIHCLFTVIHCSFANDGMLRFLQGIDGEAVERNYPLFVRARFRKFTDKFTVSVCVQTLRVHTVGRQILFT